MDRVLENLNRSPGVALLALAGIVLVLAVVVVVQAAQLRSFRAQWLRLLSSASGTSLEGLLNQHFEDRELDRRTLEECATRLDVLERKMRSSKRYLGLVRYDAFDEVGGQQSFALAVYDEDGNGAVLTSQVGRNDCRVYAKALVNGRHERHLSSEEERAIELAGTQRSQARVSP